MPENQLAGFTWEDNVLESVFQTRRGGYSDPHDCPKERNRFNPQENVSIKTTGSGTVFLSDVLRVYDYSPDDKHTAIVIQYVQTDDRHKVLRRVYELSLDNKSFLFGSVGRHEIEDLVKKIKSVPPGPVDINDLREIHAMKKELNARSGIVQFNPKLDSKKQRRLQCSIPKFASYPSILLSQTNEPVVRGITIRDTLESGRRVRNARVEE